MKLCLCGCVCNSELRAEFPSALRSVRAVPVKERKKAATEEEEGCPPAARVRESG